MEFLSPFLMLRHCLLTFLIPLRSITIPRNHSGFLIVPKVLSPSVQPSLFSTPAPILAPNLIDFLLVHNTPPPSKTIVPIVTRNVLLPHYRRLLPTSLPFVVTRSRSCRAR